MEDLYGDLENYQFDNIVSELKNENQELKCKLDEYATTMGNLQKDFDNLSAEYKKLEINYSSLLKTARAEIERKSQMITNLNIEKDKLVIEAMQNRQRGTNRRKNLLENKQQTGKVAKEGDSTKQQSDSANLPTNNNNFSGASHYIRKDKQDKSTISQVSGLMKDASDKEKDQTFKKRDLHKEKNKNEVKKSKDNYLDAYDNGAVISTDRPTLSPAHCPKDNHDFRDIERKYSNFDVSKDRDKMKNDFSKSNENYSDGFTNSAIVNKVSKIRNRRKSMPLINRSDFKYSSDEDQDEGRDNDQHYRRKTPLRDDRIYHDKYRDRYRDVYRDGRNDPERKVPNHTRLEYKHGSNYDSSRNMDRKTNTWYRENDRHKSRDSRDRYESNQRFRRYCSPDRLYDTQGEYNNKLRESNDRPLRYDNVRHRTFVSPPSEKYNQNRRSREFDGHRIQHELLNPMKHKLHDVNEEPLCKRKRSDSINKPSDKHMFLHDRDVEGPGNSMSRQLELSYLSLQSPDHVHMENLPPVHHIKEIKSTSDTKLDDPRLTSKKYIVNTHSNKVVLSTVVGRDVDIKDVDTTKWNIKKDKNTYEMPIALREKPPISDDLVNNIYMAIDDNPLSNLSLESGEICLEDEANATSVNKGIVTDNTLQGFQDFNSRSLYSNNVRSNDQMEVIVKEPTDLTNNEQQACSTLLSKNYKIPKIKKSNTSKLLEKDSSNNLRNKGKSDNTKQGNKKKTHKIKRNSEKKLLPDMVECNSLKNLSDSIDICNSHKQKMCEVKQRKLSPEKLMIPTKDTVEGDLELSDETCDYVDVSEQTKYHKENKGKQFDEINKNVLIDNISKDLNKGDAVKTPETIFKHEITSSHDNKHFNTLNIDHKTHPKEPLNKTLKELKSKDIKNKLSDLFGDTSSLITLDDLGVVAPTTTKENLNEYAPLFDNTQDAVDLNVEEMEKVQTRSMNLKSGVNALFVKDDKKEENLKIPKETENEDNAFMNSKTQKFNNIEKSTSIQNIFGNVNKEPEDKNVVKTVIISTGVQNNCLSGDTMHLGDQGKTLTLKKTSDKASSSSDLLSIKALATSTPYKPQTESSLSIPQVASNSNNSTNSKDVSNMSVSNTENVCKTAQSNSDIPDVRIIVKRRRKGKAAPP